MKEQVIQESLNYLHKKYNKQFEVIRSQSLNNAGNTGNQNVYELSIKEINTNAQSFLFTAGYPDTNTNLFTVVNDDFKYTLLNQKVCSYIQSFVNLDNISLVVDCKNTFPIEDINELQNNSIPEILTKNLDKVINFNLYFAGLDQNLSLQKKKEIIAKCIQNFYQYNQKNFIFEFTNYSESTPIQNISDLDYKIGEDISKSKPFINNISEVRYTQLGPIKIQNWILTSSNSEIPEEWLKKLSISKF